MSRILAKSSGETLSEHTIECLRATQSLIDSLPLPEKEKMHLSQEVLLAVALHDVGKAAKGFQEVLLGKQQNWQGKRHEIISAAFASGIEGISEMAVFAILTHHKSIPTDGITEIFGGLPYEQIPIDEETAVWKEMAKEWKENCPLFQEDWEKICDYISGIIGKISPDRCELRSLSLHPSWLERGSGQRGQRKCVSFENRFHASLIRGLVITSDHLGSVRKMPPKVPNLRDFHIYKSEQSPRHFQEYTGNVDGSAILRAPTGSGKTEAALLWAKRNQKPRGRLFYILPYTASINAMYRRLKVIFGENVGLVHHRATAALYSMLESDENLSSRLDKQEIAAVFSGLGREIYFPIRVCTAHQILRQTLRGKGWEYMLAEFPNACFIVDEIHAYDPRVVGLTLGSTRLISQWGAKFLFLSATLPSFLRKLITDTMGDLPFIEPDPMKEDDRKILDKKRHIVEIEDKCILDCTDMIVQSIQNRPSTLIVCNHVRTAQEVYHILKKKMPSERIKLLHSQFNQKDRNNLESEIIRALPKVLIATQVVEVSLDVDFDQAFLESAPIDALIQRMGRVNRFGNSPPVRVVIFTKQVSPYHLYCECRGDSHKLDCRVKLTIQNLQKLENPTSEKDLVLAADRVYENGYQGEDKTKFDEGFNHTDIRDFEHRLLAGAYQDWVEAIIEKTDGIFEVLPISLKNEYEDKQKEGLWIEANSLLVPLRSKKIAGLKGVLRTETDPWTINCLYSSDEGLKTEEIADIA